MANPRVDLQRQLGLYEVETRGVIKACVRPGTIAIDIGAGDGYEAIGFANLGATVHAYEPNPTAVEAFRANLELNPHLAARIIVHPLAYPSGQSPRADFAKVDVDGAELDVLRALTNVNSVLVETHSLELERDCAAFLRSQGYTVRVIRNAWWRPLWPEHRPSPHNRWLVGER